MLRHDHLGTPTKRGPPYAAVGRCIYCPPDGVVPAELGDEHIIPLAFGSEILLPRSSCKYHEALTSKFEDHCFKGMLETARDHIRLKGRQKHRKRDRLRAHLTDGSRSDAVPIDRHPSALIVPRMPPPTIWIDQHESEDIPLAVQICIKPMSADIVSRARKIAQGKDVNLTRGLNASEFYRLVAKIAHVFAVAQLGYGSFAPYLINLIELRQPLFAGHLVGGVLGDDPPISDHLHEIDFAPSIPGKAGDELIMIRVRLFANHGMPNHYAVVGSRWIRNHHA